MKLLRYGPVGHEKPGMLDAKGAIRDLSKVIDDVTGAHLTDPAMAKLRTLDPGSLPVVEGKPRIGACVGKVGKIVCIGVNYADHAAEMGNKVPPEPVIFMKAPARFAGRMTTSKSRALPSVATGKWSLASLSVRIPNTSARQTR